MPRGREETGGLVERGFPSEIGRVVGRIVRVGCDPLRVMPAEVAAVELVVESTQRLSTISSMSVSIRV